MNEETEVSLETVPEDLEDITIEYYEGVQIYYNGSEVNSDNPLPVEIITTDVGSESLEQEESIRSYEEATVSPEMELESIESYSSNLRSSPVRNFKNLWKLKINSSEYDVLFPSNAALEVVSGKLYNMGNNNITGVIVDSNFSDSSYFSKTITILPVASSNTQTTVYRYGSRIYITDYSTGQNNNLVTNVTYVQPDVAYRPSGWSLSKGEWVLCALLLFSILVSILVGIFRI